MVCCAGIIPDTGDLALAPARFLPANATATGLIWANGFVYAATSNTCGGAPTAVYAMDFMAETKPVTTWQSDGAPIVGLALGTDGTVFASTGGGSSQYANSIVALDGATLKLKDWLRHDSAFNSTPIVFDEDGKTYVAATSGSRLYVLDAGLAWRRQSPDSAVCHAGCYSCRTGSAPRTSTGGRPRDVARSGRHAVDSDGNEQRHCRVQGGRRRRRALPWSACGARRTMASPRTPIIVNGVVFALAGGSAGANAVLYALDPATGKELWNSGATITSTASAGMSAGTGQVHVVTSDNTVYAFGIPLAIN